MSKGASQKTTETGTSQVQLPAWMSQAGQDLYGKTQADSAAHPVAAYNGQLAPGMAANQSQANTQAAATANTGQPQLAAAGAVTASALGQGDRVNPSSFTPAAAASYASPYLHDVQQQTLGEMQRQGQVQMQGVGDSAEAAHAFGGTRHAVAEGEAAKGINNNMLTYLANSNQAGYENAQGQFNADANRSLQGQTTNAGLTQDELNRRLGAGTEFGNLAQQASGVNSDNIMNLLKTGQTSQDTQANQDSAQYQEALRLQNGDVQRDQDVMSILAGTPRNVTTNTSGTTTQKNNPGWLSTALGVAQIGASAFSDTRLKRDVERIGTRPDGLGIFEWDYIDDPALPVGRQRGVMAEEVARLRPDALGPLVNGFATVDYSKLEGAYHGSV